MVTAALLALSVALAAPGQSGLFLPGAEPVEGGDIAFGIGTFAGASLWGAGVAALGETTIGITDRLTFHGVTAAFTSAPQRPGDTQVFQEFDLRWLAVNREHFRLAPVVLHMSGVAFDHLRPYDGEGRVAAGVAMEWGWKVLRFDLMAAPLMVRYTDGEAPPLDWHDLAIPFNTGVSLHLGQANRLRLGGPLPTFSWQLAGEHAYLETYGMFAGVGVATGATLGVIF